MDAIKQFLQENFSAIDQCEPYSQACLEEFLHMGPLHYFIPQEMGGKSNGSPMFSKIKYMFTYSFTCDGRML